MRNRGGISPNLPKAVLKTILIDAVNTTRVCVKLSKLSPWIVQSHNGRHFQENITLLRPAGFPSTNASTSHSSTNTFNCLRNACFSAFWTFPSVTPSLFIIKCFSSPAMCPRIAPKQRYFACDWPVDVVQTCRPDIGIVWVAIKCAPRFRQCEFHQLRAMSRQNRPEKQTYHGHGKR